jgi:glycosyltransferase involved in cell wall biosynthesis
MELPKQYCGQRGNMRKEGRRFEKIIIGTFSAWKNDRRLPINGMIEPLISYFGSKTKEIIVIDCPHPGSDTVTTVIDEYINNKLKRRYSLPLFFPNESLLRNYNNEIKTQPLFKIRDLFSSLRIIFKQKTPADLFIGLESIHTLAGILGKKFNKVRQCIYYVSDYSPNRYSSSLFNKVYLALDRYCAAHADAIWDVSPAMMPARVSTGFDSRKAAKHILVPNALFTSQIRNKDYDALEPFSLVFAGTIGKINGLDLAIEAFADARKELPKLKLHVLGAGVKEDEERVEFLIKKYKLDKHITHHGFVGDLEKVSDIVSSCMVGLAPYRAIPGSIRWYADATKIRLYFAAGLPVISSHVPPLAKEAERANAALVVQDTRKQFADAIIKIFRDKKLYVELRRNAIKYAKNNTWENSYSNAIKNMY